MAELLYTPEDFTIAVIFKVALAELANDPTDQAPVTELYNPAVEV